MKTVVVGTAGHIDHGKSTLVRALTGIDPDRLKEEIARGITIDLGFAHAVVAGVEMAFVDVPGHERFVRNMLAGAGGIDAVMLVVSAAESVKPQTREHFEICRLLGVDRGLVVLTKADLVDADTIAQTIADVRALVAGSFLDAAPIVAVSARTGTGLDGLRIALGRLADGAPRLAREDIVRLPVDRVFTVKGFGAVVTGTLVSGRIAVGDALAVLPSSETVRVRGLQVHGSAAEFVSAPQRVAVNVAGIDAARLHRGVTLASAGTLAVTTRADVRLQMLAGGRPLAHGARVRVHHGTTEAFARVSVAATRGADATADWVPARPGDARLAIEAGGGAFARLRFAQPIVLTRGDRLVIRAASPVATIGGGVVLDPEPRGGGVRRDTSLARFRGLDAQPHEVVIAGFLRESGEQGLSAQDLIRRAGLDRRQSHEMIDALGRAGVGTVIADRIVSTAAMADVRTRVLAEVGAFHRVNPNESGVPRETLRARAAARTPTELFDAVILALASQGVVTAGERIALASHRPAVSSADAKVAEAVAARLRAAGLTPPDASVLATELRVPEAAVHRAIQTLVRERLIGRAGELVFHREALEGLRVWVAGLRAGHTPNARVTLDVAAFKAQHGLTRKHAIPLLEWLDWERLTRRVGDVRIVL